MKFYFLSITFLLVSQFAFAQDILIPYKKGDQFGLCNKDGKIVMQPKFDNIWWRTNEYFETQTKILINDTLETSPNHYFLRRNDEVKVSGLIYKGKEIVSNQPYRDYRIYANNCIIAKCETRYNHLTKEQYKTFKQKDKFVSLLSTDGKNVYPDNFRRLDLYDSLFIATKNNKFKKMLLFKSQNFNERLSLFIYDIDRQSISEWLIKDAVKLSLKRVDAFRKVITVEYTDSNFYMLSELIDYSTGKFQFIRQETSTEKKYGNMGSSSGRDGIRENDYSVMDDNVAVPMEESISTKGTVYEKPPFKPFYKSANDSLFYVTDTDKKTYLDIEKGKFYFVMIDRLEQYEQPVIYQRNNKYGLIIKGNFEPNIYDSLFYFGGNYLAYLKEENKLKSGVLFANGKVNIPFIYDSIQGQMKEYTMRFAYKGEVLELTEKKTYTSYNSNFRKNIYVKNTSDRLIVYKNGKCGILSNKNDTLIPVKYDLIAENGLGNMSPRTSNYIILKNGNKYGVTNLKWNSTTKGFEMANTIEPVFSAIPTYYYNNYYSLKDFKLFALYDEVYKFIGYANEKGFVYADNN